MRLFYATQAISEYSPQISLLQLCMCVKVRLNCKGEIPPVPPLSRRNPAHVLICIIYFLEGGESFGLGSNHSQFHPTPAYRDIIN